MATKHKANASKKAASTKKVRGNRRSRKPSDRVLSADEARKTLDMEFSNLANKVRSGRTLTKAERVALHQVAYGSENTDSGSLEASPVDVVSTKTALAKVLGVSRRTLQNHWNDPGRPSARSDGAYDVMQFRQWSIAAGFGKSEEMTSDVLPPKQELEARLLLIKIDHASLALSQKRKELIPRSDHRAGLKWLAAIFTQALDGIPERLALRGVNESTRELVLLECKETKEQIARFIAKA